MPPFEIMDRRQVAVLLPAILHNNYPLTNKKGEVAVDVNNPVELWVRWVDVVRQRTDTKGNPVTIEGEVVVNMDITPGSIMWRGTLEAYLGTGTGGASGGGDAVKYMRVESFGSTWDIKRRIRRRTVEVCRWRKALPVLP
jgi:hypothetical protein